ncbi:hypothetical protein FYJ24_05230 [Actinomycetaceae bacterium WB03_NA08]|uniref:ATP-dependent helicase Rep n=1 Tax=Scrofimicrobium canadense TaxID=2652290 RepID=A0A6N7W7P8_9ACTO|nr:hypothetical protein [Scrofimicrobium canadense]MSS84178.1 hypothetical protein [Scrofimicrobium canadense]
MYGGVVGQLEEGTDTGYRHFQVYVEHTSPIKFTTLRNKFPKGHFEPRRGSKRQAYEYVTKEDSRVVGEDACHIETGSIDLKDNQGKRSDLVVFHDAIMEQGMSAQEVMREYPGAYRYASNLEALQNARDQEHFSTQMRDIEVTYIHGAPGVGKTRYVFDKYDPARVYRVTDYKHPFDAYHGQDVLVLDEFDSQINFDLLMNVLDRYPLELPARYRNKWAGYTKVVIISNLPLADQYQDIYWSQRKRWGAFIRRIHHAFEMTPGGLLVKDDAHLQGKIVPTPARSRISDADVHALLNKGS